MRQDGGASRNGPFCTSSHHVGRYTVTRSVFSLIVRCWHDVYTDTTRLQVVRTDTAEEVHLDNASFLLRFSMDEGALVERCFIRHIASGREVYVQSGSGLRAFITSCLLADQR
jgi:hypothetical protein